MGRLRSVRAQVMATIGFLVFAPVAVVGTARLEMSSGAPGLGLLLPLVVALLLSVGPRAAPAVVAAFVLDAIVVGDQPLAVLTVGVAVAQAAVALAVVLLLERRLAHHGPVRSPVVVVEFAAIVGVALPLLVNLLPELAAGAAAGPWPGPYPQRVIADGIGVLTIAPGVRMLLVRARLGLERSVVAGVWSATVLTVASVLLILRLGGIDALVNAQVLAVPLLLLALFVGTAGYAIGVALSTIGIVVPLSLLGAGGELAITTPIHAVWLLVAIVGMLLATEGDRRRAAAVEFRTFFQHSATPTLSVNAGTGLVTQVNRAAVELLGRPARDLAGRMAADLVGANDRVRERLDALLGGEVEEFTEEFALGDQEDAVRWVRCAALRVDLPNPQADVVQVQFLDLTTERERASALERSNEALERFGRRVTHDLKQPLAAVAAYASTLAEHGERMDPEVVRTMYERLEAVAHRAVTQLDDTFSAAVTTSGPEAVNLHEVLASVVGVVDIDLTETGGIVDTALAVSRVHADGSMLRQVLLNLLTNSIKYARQDTPPRIRVSSRVRGAGVEVTVTDNGTGIPADQLTAVFERGRRLDPDRADGRGHGLADSRDLAESVGGWLRAEPWPEGARFVLWLPDPSVAATAAATRVLLVDDEPDALTVLAHRLELDPGIEVVGTAVTMEEAIGATRELRPDVVLLDRWLRDQDGLARVVELARAHPDVRIILLTAHVTPDLDERARHGGVLRTLDKAVSDEDLVAQVIGSTN